MHITYAEPLASPGSRSWHRGPLASGARARGRRIRRTMGSGIPSTCRCRSLFPHTSGTQSSPASSTGVTASNRSIDGFGVVHKPAPIKLLHSRIMRFSSRLVLICALLSIVTEHTHRAMAATTGQIRAVSIDRRLCRVDEQRAARAAPSRRRAPLSLLAPRSPARTAAEAPPRSTPPRRVTEPSADSHTAATTPAQRSRPTRAPRPPCERRLGALPATRHCAPALVPSRWPRWFRAAR